MIKEHYLWAHHELMEVVLSFLISLGQDFLIIDEVSDSAIAIII